MTQDRGYTASKFTSNLPLLVIHGLTLTETVCGLQGGKSTNPQPLFRASARPLHVSDSMPSVSPDGKRVAFVTNHTDG